MCPNARCRATGGADRFNRISVRTGSTPAPRAWKPSSRSTAGETALIPPSAIVHATRSISVLVGRIWLITSITVRPVGDKD